MLGVSVSKIRKSFLDLAIQVENVLASHLHLELDNVIKLAKKADKSFYG